MPQKYRFGALYSLIALSTIPFFLFVKVPESFALSSENTLNITRYFGSVLGYIGVALLLWMYVLGTRSMSALFFDDVPHVNKVHSWLGKYGILLVFAHPILTTIAYSKSLLTYSFSLSVATSYEKHVTLGRLALFSLIIIWVTSVLIRSKIAYRPWKYIHYLAYIALPLSFLHVPEIGSSYSQTFVQFYWLSFIVIFFIFSALRLRHFFGFGKVHYTIVDTTQYNELVRCIILRPANKAITVRNGQYIYIQPSLLSEEHPFTVLNHLPNGDLAVAYKTFGNFTKKLNNLGVGESVLVDGPYGTFTNKLNINPSTPSVFIAGGIGITPFAKHILEGQQKDSWLFYANQSPEGAVLRNSFKTALEQRYIDIFSVDKTTTDSNVEHGYVSPSIFGKYLKNPRAYQYFICGPEGMMDTSHASLLKMGVPNSQIHIEKFSF